MELKKKTIILDEMIIGYIKEFQAKHRCRTFGEAVRVLCALGIQWSWAHEEYNIIKNEELEIMARKVSRTRKEHDGTKK